MADEERQTEETQRVKMPLHVQLGIMLKALEDSMYARGTDIAKRIAKKDLP